MFTVQRADVVNEVEDASQSSKAFRMSEGFHLNGVRNGTRIHSITKGATEMVIEGKLFFLFLIIKKRNKFKLRVWVPSLVQR